MSGAFISETPRLARDPAHPCRYSADSWKSYTTMRRLTTVMVLSLNRRWKSPGSTTVQARDCPGQTVYYWTVLHRLGSLTGRWKFLLTLRLSVFNWKLLQLYRMKTSRSKINMLQTIKLFNRYSF